MKIFHYIFLALFFFIVAPAFAEENKFFDEVQISRFDGDQPWYNLTIKPDGSGEFSLSNGVLPRTRSVRLTPEQLKEIRAAIDRADFFSLPHAISGFFHSPTVTVEITQNGKKHAAMHILWPINRKPTPEMQRLDKLVYDIERAAHVEDMVTMGAFAVILIVWSYVGIPVGALFLLTRWNLKRELGIAGKTLTVAAFSIFGFVLSLWTIGVVFTAISNPRIYENECYKLSEDGWKHCAKP